MYAQHTKVPVDQTKAEIERTLARYGADRFAYFIERGKAIIIFEAHGRRLRFDLPVAEGDSEKDQRRDGKNGGRYCSASKPSSKRSRARSRASRKRFLLTSSCRMARL